MQDPTTTDSVIIERRKSMAVDLTKHSFEELERDDSIEMSKSDEELAEDELELLTQVVLTAALRHKLINKLLGRQSDFVEKIHFCRCVDQFEHATGAEKETKGRKIVELFVTKGAMFQVKDISELDYQTLKEEHDFTRLSSVKEDFFKALCDSAEVLAEAKKIMSKS
jgi:hypothetical protein